MGKLSLSNFACFSAWAAADGWYTEGCDQPAGPQTWPTWRPDHGSPLYLAGTKHHQYASTLSYYFCLAHFMSLKWVSNLILTCAGPSGWPGDSHWPAWSPLGQDRNWPVSGEHERQLAFVMILKWL